MLGPHRVRKGWETMDIANLQENPFGNGPLSETGVGDFLEEAKHSATGLRSKPNPLLPEEELVRRGRRAEKFVHQGEVSRARQALCSQAEPRHCCHIERGLRPRASTHPIVRGHPSGSQQILAAKSNLRSAPTSKRHKRT